MARKGTTAHRKRDKTPRSTNEWRSLTWDDLSRWTDSRSITRGKAYQRQGRVKELALADDGRLLATVMGSQRYATSAWLAAGEGGSKQVESTCTCPVGVSCKHAVAVVTDFLEALADKRKVPAAEPDDSRWAELSGENADLDDECDDNVYIGSANKRSGRPKRPSGKRRTRAAWDELIQSHIQQKGREELSALVWSLVERFPELRQEFQERITLADGDVGRLVAGARRELRHVTEQAGWRNSWKGEGFTPDYSRLKHRLERIVEIGHCDEVVELGRELIARGMEQVGQSDDEGETSMALAYCLPVVFDALVNSSLAAPEKILYAIDAYLIDEYDLIGSAADKVMDAKWSAADWSAVADKLAERLASTSGGIGRDDFFGNYGRDQMSNWLLDALENAGRGDEASAVYETEARATGSYQRLVNHLLEHKKYEEATRWAREGIEKTHKQWPGIAHGLTDSLCELARRRRQWNVVAAHAACTFLGRPSVHAFEELEAASKKAKCQEPVRAAALRFLESGVPPVRLAAKGKDCSKAAIDPAWPLPVPEYLVPLMSDEPSNFVPQPHYDVLLEMAIADKRPNDVLRWYDAMAGSDKPSNRGPRYLDRYFDTDGVAKAVARTHPERALEIYRRELDSHLPQADTSAYETCAECLRQMRPIYKSLDKEDYWNELLDDIRHKYGNRPRFMETLDRMEGRTILQSRKTSRRR